MASPLPIIPGRLPAAPDKYDRDNEAITRRIIELALARGPTAVGGGTTTVVPDDFLMDATDRREGLGSAGATMFDGGSLRNAATAGIFWVGGVVSAGHVFGIHAGSGLSLRKSSTGSGAMTISPEWPIFQLWSTLGITAATVSRLRYTFSCSVMRHAATAEIGVRNKGLPIGTDNTNLGYALVDDSGVWVLKRRLTTGGSLDTLTTLVSPLPSSTVMRRFKIVYEEGDPAILSFYLDNVLIYETVDDADVPEYPVSGAVGYGPAVCENILTIDSRFTIEVLERPA